MVVHPVRGATVVLWFWAYSTSTLRTAASSSVISFAHMAFMDRSRRLKYGYSSAISPVSGEAMSPRKARPRVAVSLFSTARISPFAPART